MFSIFRRKILGKFLGVVEVVVGVVVFFVKVDVEFFCSGFCDDGLIFCVGFNLMVEVFVFVLVDCIVFEF